MCKVVMPCKTPFVGRRIYVNDLKVLGSLLFLFLPTSSAALFPVIFPKRKPMEWEQRSRSVEVATEHHEVLQPSLGHDSHLPRLLSGLC